MSDVWTDIITFQQMPTTTEYVHYPTQKPLTLLKRIIGASSNNGDIVLDPFCGSGTACLAAQRLGRKFVGIDISEEACAIARRRVDEKQTMLEDNA